MAVARINGVKLPQARIALLLAGHGQSERFGDVITHLERKAKSAARVAVALETARVCDMTADELAKLLDDEASWDRIEAHMRAVGKSDER